MLTCLANENRLKKSIFFFSYFLRNNYILSLKLPFKNFSKSIGDYLFKINISGLTEIKCPYFSYDGFSAPYQKSHPEFIILYYYFTN